MSEELTTKPTMETLLEMMRGLREEVRAGFKQVNDRLDTIERKINVLNQDFLTIRADIVGIEGRVSKLEESRQ